MKQVGELTHISEQKSQHRIATARRPYERPRLRPINRGRWRALVAATAATDLIAVCGALVAASVIRFRIFGDGVPVAYGRWLPVWMALWFIGLLAAGMYDRHRTENALEELRHLVQGVTLGTAIAVVMSFTSGFALSRAWAAMALMFSLISVGMGRLMVRRTIQKLRTNGRLRRRTVIVGTDSSALRLAEEVERATWEGIDIAGFVSIHDVGPPHVAGAPVLGPVRDLREIVRRDEIDEVIVSPRVSAEGNLGTVIAAIDGVPVELRVSPGVDGFLPSRIAVHPLGDRPLLAVERTELQMVARLAKRVIDLVVGSMLLVIALPVIGIAAAAIRFDSRGPALFRQVRIGMSGRPFRVWKLRTMIIDAHRRKDALEQRNESGGLLFKIKDDPRVTRVGRFLRRTSLDELPQLFNVLLGEMSLVGPRPPLPEEVAQYDDWLGRRLLVKPGITGLWQVSGRNELSFDDYVRFDLLYVQNWSVALDLFILAKTVPAVLLRKGAY